jgi:hypothetical protein
MESFAASIVAMAKHGHSEYPHVDGETVCNIPPHACKGRTGTFGKTFIGYVDLEMGFLRFDCVEECGFYLHVDLRQVPAFSAAPGGPDAEAAAADFEGRVGVELEGPLTDPTPGASST